MDLPSPIWGLVGAAISASAIYLGHLGRIVAALSGRERAAAEAGALRAETRQRDLDFGERLLKSYEALVQEKLQRESAFAEERAKLLREIDSNREQIAALAAAHARLEREVEGLRGERVALQREIARLQGVVSDLQQAVTRYQQEKLQLVEQVTVLEEKLAAAENRRRRSKAALGEQAAAENGASEGHDHA